MGLIAGLAEGLLEAVFPTRCAGCDLPGGLLCSTCRDSLVRVAEQWACPRCGAPYGHIVCTECWEAEFAFSAAVAVGTLERPLSRMVTLYKDGGERRLSAPLAALLAARVEPWRGWPHAVVAVPATTRAVRDRGFDHMALVVRDLAAALDLPALDALGACGARDMRALSREERRCEVHGAFELRPQVRVPPRVLLVDDVLTTGSTLDAAARVLLDAGAGEVRAAVLARAW